MPEIRRIVAGAQQTVDRGGLLRDGVEQRFGDARAAQARQRPLEALDDALRGLARRRGDAHGERAAVALVQLREHRDDPGKRIGLARARTAAEDGEAAGDGVARRLPLLRDGLRMARIVWEIFEQ